MTWLPWTNIELYFNPTLNPESFQMPQLENFQEDSAVFLSSCLAILVEGSVTWTSALGPATFPSTRRATPKAEQTGDRPTIEVIGKDTVISILERQFSWRSCNHSIHCKNKFRLKFESCHFWNHSGNHRVRKAASQFSSPAQKCSVTWPSALVPSFLCPRRIVPTTGEKIQQERYWERELAFLERRLLTLV